MARITFKAKSKPCSNVDGSDVHEYINIPKLTRSHCDMAAFRQHSKYGGYANSDMFIGMLSHIRGEVFGNRATLRLDRIPAGVQVDISGFLIVVSFDV